MADVHVPEEKPTAIAKVAREPLAFMPKNLDEMWRISEMISKSALAPPSLVGKPYDVQLVLMTGWELGLSATQSLRDIDVVKGRPYMRALLKVALVKQSPVCRFFRLVESTNERCIYETHREGEGLTRFEFTVEDADRAGVLGRSGKDGKPLETDNWTKWLRLMLRRRCASQLADEVYPDVVRGIGDKEDVEEQREREINPAPVGLNTVAPPPPPVEAEVVPSATPPKARKLTLAEVPTQSEAVKAAGGITNSEVDRAEKAGSPPVMSEYDQLAAKLMECATADDVDTLTMANINFKGDKQGERESFTKLARDRRATLVKGAKK